MGKMPSSVPRHDMFRRSIVCAVIMGSMIAASPTAEAGNEAMRIPVDVWEPPFNQDRQHVRQEYARLAHASKPWQLCASIPHLKDNYWLAVNFALVHEAQRLGVRLSLFEAGGYEHLQRQKGQIAECVDNGATSSRSRTRRSTCPMAVSPQNQQLTTEGMQRAGSGAPL